MIDIKRQDVKECCRRICAGFNENSICRFADNKGLLGFIDTSAEHNGTRGIAFSDSGVYVNSDGNTVDILYKNINKVNIISSFEDSFADKLSILYDADKKIVISDFSLDKSELKKLIDGLCAKAPAEKQSAVPESSSEKDIPYDPDDHKGEFADDDYDIFDNEIPQLFRHQDDYVDIIFEDRAPVVSETILPPSGTRRRVIETIETRDPTQIMSESSIYNDQSAEQQPKADDPDELYEDEAAERTRIQNMSPEETLSFLAKSMSEINSPLPEPVPQPRKTERDTRSSEIRNRESALSAGAQIKAQSPANQTNPTNQTPIKVNSEQHTAARDDKKPSLPTIPLTEEPIWGDIYIKASRNLRELCESGRLSMDQIEKELNSRLLDSAKAFAEIIADEAKVPKVLIPKITELKATAKNFDQYFQMGEDIAVRAMFFMMYQMLSYADRIVETPETKERLNDFFRRFGSAGITLSMLDMRV